jgi:hypothetical protein
LVAGGDKFDLGQSFLTSQIHPYASRQEASAQPADLAVPQESAKDASPPEGTVGGDDNPWPLTTRRYRAEAAVR